MRRRAVVMFTIVLLLMVGLMLRVYDLSGQHSILQAAEQQSGMSVTVANARGTIYDCKLRPLVNTSTQLIVCATSNPAAIAALSECMDTQKFDAFVKKLQQGKPAVTTVEKIPSMADGLTLFQSPVRTPEKTIAPHVMGYMSGDGVHGATGAELVFDDLLNTYAGSAKVTYTVDAAGKPLEGISPEISDTLTNAKGGVILTIDKDIQEIAEAAAKQYMTKGAVVVMQPTTGRIFAMVSLPDFQPGTVADCLDDSNSPLLNRALCNYNCGSVFKIATTAAAIEAGIPLNTTFQCEGSYSVGDVLFHCHNRLGHGSLNMKDAFAQSCNPYFIQLGLRVGGRSLYKMATALGFDRPIFLADGWKTARAILPSELELESPAAVANLSFGQGALLASPVHIAQLVGVVLNNGDLIKPTLFYGTMDAQGTVTEEKPTPGQSVFSPSTAATLRDMMNYTVTDGTGIYACPLNDKAGGKTGTAETGWKIDGKEVVQSWFAGYYPAQEPEYVITVLAEDTYGTGGKSNLVFKKICEEISTLKKIQRLQEAIKK